MLDITYAGKNNKLDLTQKEVSLEIGFATIILFRLGADTAFKLRGGHTRKTMEPNAEQNSNQKKKEIKRTSKGVPENDNYNIAA